MEWRLGHFLATQISLGTKRPIDKQARHGKAVATASQKRVFPLGSVRRTSASSAMHELKSAKNHVFKLN